MNTTKFVLTIVIVSLLAAGGYGLYQRGLQQGMKSINPAASPADTPKNTQNMAATKPKPARKVLYWRDPMMPAQKFDKPGKSPYMDMELEPVYADDAGDDSRDVTSDETNNLDSNENKISINSQMQQNLGMRTAEVIKGTLTSTLAAVGTVDYNERDVALVQARSNGFIEKTYVRATLDAIHKGQVLAELYVPDWVAAQEEFISVQQMNLPNESTLKETLRDGARQRMRLAGMSDEQIRKVESSGKVQARITITAPASGVVTELNAREGMTVSTGAPLYRINGTSTVWVYAEIPESDAAQIRPGTLVEARTAALPETVFSGKISALLPEINATTRTLKARIELANKHMQLVPGMFMNISVNGSVAPSKPQDALLVPTEAIIQTGKRSVVIVAQAHGKFSPVDVTLGRESNGQTEILSGIKAGQKVVISGQFLVDSEASLKGTTTRMADSPDTKNKLPDAKNKMKDMQP